MSAFMWSPEVQALAEKVRQDLKSRQVDIDDAAEIATSINTILSQPNQLPADQAFRNAVRACVLDLNKVERFWRPEE